MFETLIESQRKPDKKRFLRVGFVSLTIHTALIAAAIIATVKVGQSGTTVRPIVTVYYVDREQSNEHDEVGGLVCDCLDVVLPPEIGTLRGIPRIELPTWGDPSPFSGVGVGVGVANSVGSTGELYPESLVDRKPSVLSAPQPPYPELLHEAGIGGRVVIEAIIDTSGRAEPNSVKIIQSPNPAFDPGSRNWILQAQFRPARVYGHAVRVLIRVPLDYRITGR